MWPLHFSKDSKASFPLQYSANGDSSFNPTLITLELLKAGDVEPNPGDGSRASPLVILPGRGLRISQWNIEQLTDSKLAQISLLLTTCNNVDILFLLETFLKPSKPDSVCNIPGYYMFRKDRIQKKGGGLLVYVADRVKASRILDLEDDYVESLWLSVHPHNSNRPILIGAFYRPPSTSKEIDSMI